MIGLLSDEELESMLQRHRVGRLACTWHDRPYVVPINYIYDGDAIYAYSSVGRKIGMMRSQPRVCFEVDEIDGPSAWKSVVVEGSYEELPDESAERGHALLLLTRDADSPVLRTIVDGYSDRIIIFRIAIDDRSGRFERRDA
jgi:nitroimidazol reductase NimA-like FMN-containing flavoprotein (pyridoxamine 5'-phosphate oxidase superfamily)